MSTGCYDLVCVIHSSSTSMTSLVCVSVSQGFWAGPGHFDPPLTQIPPRSLKIGRKRNWSEGPVGKQKGERRAKESIPSKMSQRDGNDWLTAFLFLDLWFVCTLIRFLWPLGCVCVHVCVTADDHLLYYFEKLFTRVFWGRFCPLNQVKDENRLMF